MLEFWLIRSKITNWPINQLRKNFRAKWFRPICNYFRIQLRSPVILLKSESLRPSCQKLGFWPYIRKEMDLARTFLRVWNLILTISRFSFNRLIWNLLSMFLKMLAVFVPKDFVRCGDMRVIARESTQTATFATLEKILGPERLRTLELP